MIINDPKNLIPKYDLLSHIVNAHPLGQNLMTNIKTLLIHESENGPNIEFDDEDQIATLCLSKYDFNRDNFEFILYHEFSHIIDRTNPDFGYSDEKKDLLSDPEKLCVMELWNIYIDARLNNHDLFKLGENDKNVLCRINGKSQKAPYSIEGKLLCHISFLRSRGFINADSIVRDFWQHPGKIRSYDDFIESTRKNIG
jgi:hypothetical protein